MNLTDRTRRSLRLAIHCLVTLAAADCTTATTPAIGSADGGTTDAPIADTATSAHADAADEAAADAAITAKDATPDAIVETDSAPAPTVRSPRQQVLDTLANQQGKRTLAGQHNKYNSTPSVSTDWITTNTGKTPALWSADFGFGADQVDNRAGMIAEAKKQWSRGAIVQLMYHNCIPTRDELCGWDDIGGATPQHLSDSDWTALVTDGTDLNNAWKSRLDALSVFFADLQGAGIAPLFRPLHEMNQPVFWWAGRSGAEGTRKLYQLTHDYLVKTKGFDNIIWVWDLQDFSTLSDDVTGYDPGPDYYDLAALDVYDGPYDSWKHDTMRAAAGAKPIAIGECETPPTSALLATQQDWVFFMLWPDFLDENASTLPALYGASNVVTEDQMPGWK
ncbi:MAG: glycoside hydrolase family 26 protein [Polyangiales bacterium]